MSKITEYLRERAITYRTKQQKAFVESALEQFKCIAELGGMSVTLLPANRAYYLLSYGAELNEAYLAEGTEDVWEMIHASAFDTGDLRVAFEAHGFEVDTNEYGHLVVSWAED